jgi:hypothetical protein
MKGEEKRGDEIVETLDENAMGTFTFSRFL